MKYVFASVREKTLRSEKSVSAKVAQVLGMFRSHAYNVPSELMERTERWDQKQPYSYTVPGEFLPIDS